MTQHVEVEIIEVSDLVEEQPRGMEFQPKEEHQPAPDEKPLTTVPIEDLVTVFVEAMTSLVERLVHKTHSIAQSVMNSHH